jgi:hypothetical protein
MTKVSLKAADRRPSSLHQQVCMPQPVAARMQLSLAKIDRKLSSIKVAS